MGVASTTDFDTRSTFSNYGNSLVWVAAPGEAVITTYPFGTYAAAWGTSFSTPFVAGTAALLKDVSSSSNEDNAESAIGNAKWIDPDLNKGRLDVYEAVKAWRKTLGLN
jgi:subtilisin family serine protease